LPQLQCVLQLQRLLRRDLQCGVHLRGLDFQYGAHACMRIHHDFGSFPNRVGLRNDGIDSASITSTWSRKSRAALSFCFAWF
jgi:hypothetical protein